MTRELILDFVEGVGETNPIFTDTKAASEQADDELLAPPMLVAVFANFDEPEDLALKFEGHNYMAGQYIEPMAPIKAGDALTCTAQVTNVYQKTGRSGPMAFVVIEHSFVNQRGEKVAVVGLSSVRRQ